MPSALSKKVLETEAKMIPISSDVRRLVGDWAEHVENRSLLYEKFSLPKVWGQQNKLHDAGRWSVLRIVSRGADLLKGDAQRLRSEAAGINVRQDVADRKRHQAQIAEKMSNIARSDSELPKAANTNATRFLSDLNKSFRGQIETFEATLSARMMINMAGGVVENAGIALDRCFGLPIIPGSAVKGIARAQALWEIHEAQGDNKRNLLKVAMLLFGFGANDIKRNGAFAWAGGAGAAREIANEIGSNDFKGYACFLPAYPTTPPKLVVDMVNPHYRKYYSGKSKVATDDDSPNPNYFPAVEAGSSFGFAILLNRIPKLAGVTLDNLLTHAKKWLESAVTHKGVGAKTAAGYGWFELGRSSATSTQAPQAAVSQTQTAVNSAPSSPADHFIARWRGRLATKDNFPAAIPEMAALTDDAQLRRAFEAVIPEQERRRLRKTNPYWQSFTSSRHGEAGKKILKRLGINLT